MNKSCFLTWKQVTVGTLLDFETASGRVNNLGVMVDKFDHEILKRTVFGSVEMTLDLTRLSVSELGLAEGATTADIYNAADQCSLSLCPPEVAWQLWLQYPSGLLRRNEWSLVGMEPIEAPNGEPCVFGLEFSEGHPWIYARNGHPEYKWGDHHQWVFVLPKHD